ncbi:hypothetical protein KA344_14725, partial [bacterium]|nr:hypothetical protein [bacterium]
MISQSKSNWYPENLNLTTATRRIIPRAFSLLLSMELVCSGLVFSAVGLGLPVRAAEPEASEKSGQSESVAPSWNDNKSDSMFIIESDAVKKVEPKVEAKPESKSEQKSEAKLEVKLEEKPELKLELESNAKPEANSTASKTDANGKAIAEVTPSIPATAVTTDSAVITTATKDSSSSSSSSAAPAASEDALVIDSDTKPEATGASAVSAPVNSATNTSTVTNTSTATSSSPAVQAISGGESAHGLE